MGNRATIIFTDGKDFSPAIYLHWNGGPESVYAFLEECDRRQLRTTDLSYCAARFVHLVGDFFDQESIGSTSLGIANGPASDSLEDLSRVETDLGDNGIYLVNRCVQPMVVRRFNQYPQLHELDPDTVAQERRCAEKDKYRTAIRETFAEIGKDKKIEGR